MYIVCNAIGILFWAVVIGGMAIRICDSNVYYNNVSRETYSKVKND